MQKKMHKFLKKPYTKQRNDDIMISVEFIYFGGRAAVTRLGAARSGRGAGLVLEGIPTAEV